MECQTLGFQKFWTISSDIRNNKNELILLQLLPNWAYFNYRKANEDRYKRSSFKTIWKHLALMHICL